MGKPFTTIKVIISSELEKLTNPELTLLHISLLQNLKGNLVGFLIIISKKFHIFLFNFGLFDHHFATLETKSNNLN